MRGSRLAHGPRGCVVAKIAMGTLRAAPCFQ
jgi:hypothetical protein